MKLITYTRKNEGMCVGILRGEEVIPCSEQGILMESCFGGHEEKNHEGPLFDDMNQLIVRCGKEPELFQKLKEISEDPLALTIPVSEVKILSPVPEPLQDVLCLGLNYSEHAREAAGYSEKAFGGERKAAVYFSKRVSYSQGDKEAIPSHKELVDKLDYEVELAVILGKDLFKATREEAVSAIFGYTVLNDVSARNLQTLHSQWYFGKSLDGFCPMGPVIVTADEIAFPPSLAIKSYVNGELRQNAVTDQLIHGIDEVIVELSAGMTLKAGTIIATGTPKGVGMGFDPPRFLKPGDEVVCEIEGIGKLKNHID